MEEVDIWRPKAEKWGQIRFDFVFEFLNHSRLISKAKDLENTYFSFDGIIVFVGLTTILDKCFNEIKNVILDD